MAQFSSVDYKCPSALFIYILVLYAICVQEDGVYLLLLIMILSVAKK